MSKDNSTKTVVDRVLALKRFASLSDLSPAALTPLAEKVVERHFRAAENVIESDVPADRMFFLLEGEVELWRRDRKLGTLSAGQVLGEIEALAAVPAARITARATVSTRALAIDRAGLIAVLEDCFPLQSAMLKRIGTANLAVRRRLGWDRVFAMHRQNLGPIPESSELGHRIVWLRATPELRRLRIRTLGRLAVNSETVDVAAGEVVWRAGDRADFIAQILRGSLHCRTAEVPPVALGPGTLVGLAEALAGSRRWCELAASSDVRMMRLDVEHVLDELEDDADVATDFLTALASEVVQLEDLLGSASERPEGHEIS